MYIKQKIWHATKKNLSKITIKGVITKTIIIAILTLAFGSILYKTDNIKPDGYSAFVHDFYKNDFNK